MTHQLAPSVGQRGRTQPAEVITGMHGSPHLAGDVLAPLVATLSAAGGAIPFKAQERR